MAFVTGTEETLAKAKAARGFDLQAAFAPPGAKAAAVKAAPDLRSDLQKKFDPPKARKGVPKKKAQADDLGLSRLQTSAPAIGKAPATTGEGALQELMADMDARYAGRGDYSARRDELKYKAQRLMKLRGIDNGSKSARALASQLMEDDAIASSNPNVSASDAQIDTAGINAERERKGRKALAESTLGGVQGALKAQDRVTVATGKAVDVSGIGGAIEAAGGDAEAFQTVMGNLAGTILPLGLGAAKAGGAVGGTVAARVPGTKNLGRKGVPKTKTAVSEAPAPVSAPEAVPVTVEAPVAVKAVETPAVPVKAPAIEPPAVTPTVPPAASKAADEVVSTAAAPPAVPWTPGSPLVRWQDVRLGDGTLGRIIRIQPDGKLVVKSDAGVNYHDPSEVIEAFPLQPKPEKATMADAPGDIVVDNHIPIGGKKPEEIIGQSVELDGFTWQVQGVSGKGQYFLKRSDGAMGKSVPAEKIGADPALAVPKGAGEAAKTAGRKGTPKTEGMIDRVAEFVREMGGANSKEIAKQFKVSNGRGAELVAELEKMGVVGPSKPGVPRQVFDTDGNPIQRVSRPSTKTPKAPKGTAEEDVAGALESSVQSLGGVPMSAARRRQGGFISIGGRVRKGVPKEGAGKTVGQTVQDVSREVQLANPVGRAVDVVANAAKMAAHFAQSPGRSLISKAIGGNERLITPARLKRVWGGGKDRWGAEMGDVLKGLDPDTQEKLGGGFFGRLSGAGDIPFKDTYRRLALDDYAADAASKLPKEEQAAFHESAWKQLTEDAPGPLSAEEIAEAKMLANDWALRQTFNIDNVVSKMVKGISDAPGKMIEENSGKQAADLWRAFVDMNFRFSKVVGNVVLERANYNPTAAGIEVAARTLFRPGGFGSKMAMKDKRLIADIASKGMAGLAMQHMGRAAYDEIKESGFIKGEIKQTKGGKRFVEWTILPKVAGGLDATQIGGLLGPMLDGMTEEMVGRSSLTKDQKADLIAQVKLDAMTSQPFTGSAKKILGLTDDGGSGLSKYAGGMAARSIIPAGFNDVGDRIDGGELRKSEGFWDEFVKRVPVWRESLPSNEKKRKGLPKLQSLPTLPTPGS
jgi:hypothetical protein